MPVKCPTAKFKRKNMMKKRDNYLKVKLYSGLSISIVDRASLARIFSTEYKSFLQNYEVHDVSGELEVCHRCQMGST